MLTLFMNDDDAKKVDDPVFDATKYLKLEIDKDGMWFQNGAPMTHPGIKAQFFNALTKTEDGHYQVKIGREVCSVIVHDAPFVVTTVDRQSDGNFVIKLTDGSQEQLRPEGLWIDRDNVPYTNVKSGAFHARFSRAAYYQLAEFIVFEEETRKYFLSVGDRKHELPLRSEQ